MAAEILPGSAEDSGHYRFFCPSFDAIEGFLDVLDRVRHAEPKITLAEVPECDAGQCSDPCVLEERVGQLFRWPSGLLDIWEDIKRAMWDATGETLDLVEPGTVTRAVIGTSFPVQRAAFPQQTEMVRPETQNGPNARTK